MLDDQTSALDEPIDQTADQSIVPALGEIPAHVPPPPRGTPSRFTDPTTAPRLASGLATARDTTPDQAARVFRLQLKTGLPPDVIRRNLDDIEQRANVQNFDADRFRRETPYLAEWMNSDRYHAALVQDDLQPLSALERAFQIGRNVAAAAAAGVARFSAGAWGAIQAGEEALGAVTTDPLTRELTGRVASFAAARGTGSTALAATLRGPQTGAGFIERNIYGGIEGLGQMAPALVAGAVLGPTALLGIVGGSTGGESYAQARAQGVGPKQSAAFGALQGAIQVAAQFIPARLLLGDLAARSGVITTLLHQVASEIPGQEAATALMDLNSWAQLPENSEKTFTDYLKERPSAAAATAIGVLVAAGGTTAAAHMTARVLGQIGDAATQSKTITRAPEKARELIAQTTAGGPLETVHLPIETFAEYWQHKGIDPVAKATELTGDPQAFVQAREAGTDLAVPMGDYVTQIAASKEHGPFFQHEARLNPDALNLREATALDEQANAATAALPPDQPRPAAAVREAVRAQLVAAGESPSNAAVHGALYEHTFATLGERAGLDPVALFERYGLQVRREGLTPDAPPANLTEFHQSLRDQVDAAERIRSLQAVDTPPGSRQVPFATIDSRTASTLARAVDRTQTHRVTVPIDQLIATQPTISEPIAIAKTHAAERGAAPRAIEYEGKYYLEDGTHTAAAAWARGETTIEVSATPVKPEWITHPPVSRSALDEMMLRQDERGRISFGPDRQFNIDLLRRADLSSFLHESAHFYLEAFSDVAGELAGRDAGTLTDAQRGILADHRTLLDWLGVTSREGIETAQHEQFARGFEAYLREGRAPSPELRTVFARVRAWLVSVYRDVRQLHVDLTPEVRGVMDRLLATDDAIAAAEHDQHVRPLFTGATADALGLSPEERARYQATVDAASERARDTLHAELLQQLGRERADWWQQERAAVRARVAPEIEADPAYRARALLESGTHADGSPLPAGVEAFKLSREALVAQFGEGVLQRLPAGVAVEGEGVPPAVAADLLGFSSATALVQALAKTSPIHEAIDAAADAEMRARHGDLLLDGTIADRAQAAVIDAGAEVFAAELKALSDAARRRPGGPRSPAPSVATLRAIAERRIADTTVREVRPGVFAAAARRAGDDALAAAGRQDFNAALQAKQQQVLNAELFRAASAARDLIDTAVAGIAPIFGRDASMAPRYDMNLVYAARSLLGQFELGPKGRELAVAAYLEKVARYSPETYGDLEAAIEAASQPAQPYREMTVAEFTALRDAVGNLVHVARRSKQIVINGEMRELEEVRGQVLQQVEKFSTPREKAGYARAVSPWDRAKVGLQGLAARMRRVEGWVSAVDNGREGPARSAIFDPVNEGAVKYETARTQAAQRYAEIARMLDTGTRFGKIEAPELNYTFQNKHQELLGAILHVGNGFEPGSNGYKLLVGRKWGEVGADGRVDTAPWRAFVDRMAREGVLTKTDYDYAQAVGDLNESFKADAQRTHHARYGVFFDEVTRVPFETPFGRYEGWYFPAIADPFITPLAADRAEANALLGGGAGGSLTFPSVNRGFSKTRTLTYAKPLILDTSAVLSHINAVLRFTHLSEPVHDVARLIMHPSFRSQMDAVDPAVVSDLLKPYLDRAASQQMFVPLQGKAGRALDAVAREIRTRGVMQLVALNATVLAEQVTHMPSALAHPDIPAGKLLAGLWRLSREPRAMARDVHEASPYMATRESAGLTQAHEALDRILLDPNPLQRGANWVRDHSTVLMRGIQSAMDLAAWQAAYDKVSSEPGASHVSAVKRADSAVREALGSYRPQDRSSSEGGHQIVGILNPLYGFWNTKLNMLGTEAVLASRLGLRRTFSRGFAVYTLGLMIPALLGEGIKNEMHGHGFIDQGEDEDAATAFLRFWAVSQGKMAARMVPGGGAAVDALARSFGSGRQGHILNTPAITMVEDALHAPGEVYKALTDSDNLTPAQKSKAITDFFTMLGMLSTLPLRPVGQAINAARDAQDE